MIDIIIVIVTLVTITINIITMTIIIIFIIEPLGSENVKTQQELQSPPPRTRRYTRLTAPI